MQRTKSCSLTRPAKTIPHPEPPDQVLERTRSSSGPGPEAGKGPRFVGKSPRAGRGDPRGRQGAGVCRGPGSRLDQALRSAAPGGSGQPSGGGGAGAQGGGSPQAQAPPGASPAFSSFYPQQPGSLALLSYFTDEEGETQRVRQLPKGTQVTRDLGQNPGVPTPGPLPAIPSTCVCGQVQAGLGATWGKGGSPRSCSAPGDFLLGA